MSRVPANIEAAYLAYLAADIPDAMAAWVTFRDLCHDNYLDTVEAANLIVRGSPLFL